MDLNMELDSCGKGQDQLPSQGAMAQHTYPPHTQLTLLGRLVPMKFPLAQGPVNHVATYQKKIPSNLVNDHWPKMTKQ